MFTIFLSFWSFLFSQAWTNWSSPIGAFRYSMLKSVCRVSVLGIGSDLHLHMVSRSPYKWHFFHFKRKPVSASHSFRTCMALMSAAGVPISAVSSQKNNGLRRPGMRFNFSAMYCMVRAKRGFERMHPFWVPVEDWITPRGW